MRRLMFSTPPVGSRGKWEGHQALPRGLPSPAHPTSATSPSTNFHLCVCSSQIPQYGEPGRDWEGKVGPLRFHNSGFLTCDCPVVWKAEAMEHGSEDGPSTSSNHRLMMSRLNMCTLDPRSVGMPTARTTLRTAHRSMVSRLTSDNYFG